MDPLNKCQICTLVYRKSFQPFIEGQSQDRTNIMGSPLKSQLAFSPFKVILREWERGGRSHKLHWSWFNIWNTYTSENIHANTKDITELLNLIWIIASYPDHYIIWIRGYYVDIVCILTTLFHLICILCGSLQSNY